MSGLVKCILDLPDEIIEEIMSFVSFADLFNLSKTKLKKYANRVAKHKPFDIAIIGGYSNGWLVDVEVISITKDYVSQTNKVIPCLPMETQVTGGTQLPNGDFLICGAGEELNVINHENDSCNYLLFKDGFIEWAKVKTKNRAQDWNDLPKKSVIVDGCMYTTGGCNRNGHSSSILCSSPREGSLHEKFSFEICVQERKAMPIALEDHSATLYSKHEYIICGGFDKEYHRSEQTFVYNIKTENWTKGPSLLTARADHSSCAIPSEDGSIQYIIVTGGTTDLDSSSNSTEILNLKSGHKKWIQGPTLPCEIINAACLALPLEKSIACVLIGGWNFEDHPRRSSNVYGLSRSLTKWTFIGKIRLGRSNHIALPLSK